MSASKLVRDNIPDIIRADGLDPIVYVAGPEEYTTRLREKLHEEVAGRDQLEELRAAKAAQSGAFTKRFIWDGNR